MTQPRFSAQHAVGNGAILDIPIPTPDGWKHFGDLVVGDAIFGADGTVCHVIARTAVFHDSQCYEVEFDDGERAQVCSGQLWTVERKTRRRVPGSHHTGVDKRIYREMVTLSTSDLADHVHVPDKRLAVAVNGPLALPDTGLPIDPYVLGAWLGDGHAAAPVITMLEEDAQPLLLALQAAGHTWKANQTGGRAISYRIDGSDDGLCLRGHARTPENLYRHQCRVCKAQYQRYRLFGEAMDIVRRDGLSQRLQRLGLLAAPSGIKLGHHKHIPVLYLRSSIEQRMALLRGLMDTDGHCNIRGTATFVNISTRLVDDVFELVASLGLKPRKYHYENGGKGYWQVAFQAYQYDNPFSLPRKAQRSKPGKRPNPRRYVVAVRSIPNIPMSYIQVDRVDGLYLMGRAMVTTHDGFRPSAA